MTIILFASTPASIVFHSSKNLYTFLSIKINNNNNNCQCKGKCGKLGGGSHTVWFVMFIAWLSGCGVRGPWPKHYGHHLSNNNNNNYNYNNDNNNNYYFYGFTVQEYNKTGEY